jgi:lipoate---protein ligase
LAIGAIRLLSLGLTDWMNTQSVYHALAEGMSAASSDTIILCRPAQPFLCLGYHQDLDAVLNRAACAALGLPVVRRRVGGGATCLDGDQVFYQCLFHHSRVPAMVNDIYARLLAGPVAVLRGLGLAAELVGENEIGVNGRRIAGIGGGRVEEAAVVVGNFLIDFNYDAMTRAWRAPSEAFRQPASEALRERVTTLRAELAEPTSPEALEASLIAEFGRALGRSLEPGKLAAAERERAWAAEGRLLSTEWLELHNRGGQAPPELKISRGVFIHALDGCLGGVAVQAALRARWRDRACPPHQRPAPRLGRRRGAVGGA